MLFILGTLVYDGTAIVIHIQYILTSWYLFVNVFDELVCLWSSLGTSNRNRSPINFGLL
jgi:hypothetical protein